MFKRTTVALLLVCALAAGVAAQKQAKAWTEWSKKDAEKILNNSGWGQTQVETDTSEMFYTPTTQAQGGSLGATRREEGATNQATHVNYFVRFFSARPVRMALARSIMLDMKNPDPQTANRLKDFAQLESKSAVIVTVTFEATDGRTAGRLFNVFNSSETSTIKNTTYLERKDGKRVFLEEYVKPGKDGFGARYIFPRVVDGQPFLTPDSGEVRFHAEMATDRNGALIDRRFKVADMMYQGALEY